MAEKFTDQELNKIVNEYIARLKTKIHLNKAVLFGSYAKGTAHSDSDIDLLVVSDELSETRPKGANGLLLDKLVGLDNVHLNLEVIGIHPAKLNNEVTKSFFDEVLATGREIPIN